MKDFFIHELDEAYNMHCNCSLCGANQECFMNNFIFDIEDYLWFVRLRPILFNLKDSRSPVKRITQLYTGTMVLLSPAVRFLFLSVSEPNVERPGNLIQTVGFFSSRENIAFRVCPASSIWRRKFKYINFD